VPLLPPLISLGFMLATHEVAPGQLAQDRRLRAPLRITAERRKSQLLMCLFLRPGATAHHAGDHLAVW